MGRPLNFRSSEANNFRELFIHTSDGRHTITRQKGTRSYFVTTHGNTVFRLVNSDTPGANQAYMKAFDSYGNVYLVTKLTRHLAVVHRYSNNEADWQFADGHSVKWNRYAGAIEGQTVEIENDD